MPMRRTAHADRLTQRIHIVQPDHVGDGAGAGVIADDDHHDQGIEKLDGEAGPQMLKAPRIVALIHGLDDHGLVEGEPPSLTTFSATIMMAILRVLAEGTTTRPRRSAVTSVRRSLRYQ